MQGFKRDELNTERFLNLRYDGTDVPVMTLCPEGGDFAQASPVMMTDILLATGTVCHTSLVGFYSHFETHSNSDDKCIPGNKHRLPNICSMKLSVLQYESVGVAGF